jgi:putative nucleotidyltransferase with HDIG domain
MSSAWRNAAHGENWIAWLDTGEWEATLDGLTPMIPALALEIAWLARDPEISAAALAEAVAHDPILAVNVVRLANSAFSASAVPITSLDDAVVRVGTRAVRQLVTAACLTSRLRNPKTYGADARAVVDHSVRTGYIATVLAERIGGDPDAAFLCGLLHDIGKFVILKLAHDDRPIPPTMGEVRLKACVASRHAAVGARALARWRFAPEIQVPVAFHHEPLNAPDHVTASAIVAAASRLAHQYSSPAAGDRDNLTEDPVFAYLQLDAQALRWLDARLPRLFDVARTIAA